MDNTTYIALSRQTALWNQLEVVANNLANVNTTGFKGTDTLFAQYVFKLPQNDRTFKDSVAFTHDFGLVRNLAQGNFNYTSNLYDVAIQGEGYFVTQGAPGQPDRYTRAGNFTIDGQGRLTTQDGRPVLSVNNAPIVIPPAAGEIAIQGDGSILNADNQQIDQIRVVRFDVDRDLKQIDGTSFVPSEGQQPIDVPNPKVAQGVLEDSNVNGVTEMTRLIALNRTYADVARLVEAENDRKKKASEVFTRQMSA